MVNLTKIINGIITMVLVCIIIYVVTCIRVIEQKQENMGSYIDAKIKTELEKNMSFETGEIK